MQIRQNKLKFIINSVVKAISLAFLITLVLGYLLNYRAIIVIGGSAEPDIHYHSLVITRRSKFEDLHVGDYITFSYTGNLYTTHKIVSIDIKNDLIVCRGNQYNSTTKQYEEQNTEQVLKYENVIGKVVYSNYILGTTFFTIRSNTYILAGLLASLMLLLYLKEQLKIEPQF